jgi:flagellar biogenesis protein FliO
MNILGKSAMALPLSAKISHAPTGVGGVADWILRRFGARSRPTPNLALLERITLGPRQTLSLVEADGRRLLIATSPEGSPAFYSLDKTSTRTTRSLDSRTRAGRTSW